MLTLAEARALLAALRPRLAEFTGTRADFAELQVDLALGVPNALGGLPEAKALQARLHAELEYFAGSGAEVRGFAPLLLDFPGEYRGQPVLWCWLEGEPDIAWYHRADTGFAGRRPLDPQP